MGIALPQLAPASEDRVSGAVVVDGSLRFSPTANGSGGQRLVKTPGASGNRKTWTWSSWIKRGSLMGSNDEQHLLDSRIDDDDRFYGLAFAGSGKIFLWEEISAGSYHYHTTSKTFKDTTAWYHLVVVVDTTQKAAADRVKFYVNGEQQDVDANSGTYPYYAENYETNVNQSGSKHFIGSFNDARNFSGYLSQVYLVDGLGLGPGYFGYTDPLTGVWRPKKFKPEGTTVNNGTNWSAGLTGTADGSGAIGLMFDGDTTDGSWSNSSGYSVTFPNGGVTATSNIKIYGGSGSANWYVVIDGVKTTISEPNGVAPAWSATGVTGYVNLGPGTLTSIGTEGAGISQNGEVSAIEIDGVIMKDSTTQNLSFGTNGFYLPFDGSGPIGQDQAPSINDGTIWSSFLTGSTNNFYTGAQAVDKAFDGDTSTYVQQLGGTNPNYITFTPSGGIAHNSTVEVYIGNAANQVSYNGGSLQTISSGWNTIATGSGTLNSIRVERPSTSGASIGAIRIDGVILLDGQTGNGDWTAENIGSTAALDKATGALPILNTGNGGNVARPGVFGSDVSTEFTVTTGTYDSATRYELDAVDRPNPTLIRGATYTFDYTDVPGHPLYLSSLPDGKHNSKAYSVQFDGTDDRLAVGTSSDYAFGTGDFAIEMFIYHTDLTGQQTYFSDAQGDNNGVYFYKDGANALSLYDDNNNVFSAGLIELNKWHHIALTRSGGVVRGFIDGVKVAEVADAHNYTETQYNIGDSHGSSSGEFIGYISNVRVLKGSALYTANFTPPTTTLTNITNTVLLCCQDSDDETAAVIPSGQSITAAGNPSATNSHNPFLYNNVHGNFGVNTATSNVTKITIPHYASDLYYYCNQHPNMGNTTAMSVVTDTEKADPYAWKCVLAMPLLGIKDDVSANINCAGSNKATVTNGNAASSDDSSNLYGGSFVFDGNSDYVTATPTSGSTLADSIGSYTIEFFFNIDSARMSDDSYNIMWSTESGLTIAKWRSGLSNKVYFESDGSATGWNIQSQIDVYANRWYHFAAVRNGTDVKVFLDGMLQGTATATYTANAETWWRVGGQSANTSTHDGFLQDFRIYKVAKYTENFIPVSTNSNILSDAPSGVATKSKLKKITDGSVSFDGASNYLATYTSSSDFSFGTEDFTVEMFLYNEETAGKGFIQISDSSGGLKNSNSGTITIHKENGQNAIFRAYVKSGSTGFTSTVPFKRWCHVALVRQSGTIKLFVDGKQDATTVSNDTTDYATTYVAIGGYYDTNYLSKCTISNVRVNKGTAVYTKDFTPPTRQLTNISGTKLLACQSKEQPGTVTVCPGISGVNDGTQWSGTVVPGSRLRSGFPAADAFNGSSKSSTNDCAAPTLAQGAFVEYDFGAGIPFTTLQMQCDDNNSGTVFVNGVNITSQLPTGSLTNTTITGVTSPLTSIRLTKTTSDASSVYLGSVTIDGTMLTDILRPDTGDTPPVATTFNPFDTADINTVRGQEGVYATLNPNDTNLAANLQDGNLKAIGASNWSAGHARGNIALTSGKWFWESTYSAGSSTLQFGFANASASLTESYGSVPANSWTYYFPNSSILYPSGGVSTYFASGASLGDTIGCALDMDNGTWQFFKNGQGGAIYKLIDTDAAATASIAELYPWVGSYNGTQEINFGQKPFRFTPPDGFQPITASTLRPDTVIARSDQYFSRFLYTGDGTSSRNLTMPLEADFLWVKKRSATNSHQLVDTVRGNNSVLHTNSANPAKNPQTEFTGGGISSISGTTATLSSGTSNNNNVNDDGSTLVGWAWKAGGSAGTFNIDGVDVGSAANAKMNDGGLTSEVYNQDYVWSANYSGNNGTAPTQAFDGTGPKKDGYAHQGAELVLNFPGNGLSGRIVVYGGCGGGSADTFTLSDGHSLSAPTLYDAAPYYDVLDFGVKSNITQLTCSSGYALYGITVDGKLLVDQGVTPPNAPSIPSTGCSVGTKQGFSIIKYTADLAEVPNSIAHGLTQKPDFAIFKNIDSTLGGGEVDWGVYHSAMTGSEHLELNDLRAPSADPGAFNGTEPTSKLFYLGGKRSNSIQSHAYLTNGPANDDFIAYIWHNVPGLQKFGTYEGNGSDAGAFVETGFRPALVWTRAYSQNSNNNNHWLIYDTLINPNNEANQILYANLSNGQGSHGSIGIDILANGFKLRADTSGYSNYTGWSYLYCAWAEAPAFNLYGATTTAR